MRFLLLPVLLVFSLYLQAQVIAGPMLGQVELRTASIWLEVSPQVRSVAVRYGKEGSASFKTVLYKGVLGKEFNPLRMDIGSLEPATRYSYSFLIDNKAVAGGTFVTKDLWQWRKPAPDFSFIAGSCTYVNEPPYDRPGKPYGGDSSIFLTMAKEPAAFMLWLGDNWYTREVDYGSEWGLWYRAQHDRRVPVLQPLLKAMPQYAIWDDHDFGPNDIGGHYILKDASRAVFKNYWANPSYGQEDAGIYTKVSHGDVDLFLLDDRWWRSADALQDSVNGQPNPSKTMLGQAQLEWLKNGLLFSSATFKIIVVGSQVLNPVSPFDKLADFAAEYNDLMAFLQQYAIKGVLFLSGDRHHSEIIKVSRPGSYPLYDITVSPLTSGTHRFSGPEQNNPYRVFGLDEKQNYGRFSIDGAPGKRRLTVSFLGIKGDDLGKWSVGEEELK